MTGWHIKRLKDVATCNDETLAEFTPEDFAFLYVDIGSVTQGRVNLPEATMTFGSAPSRARRCARPGDTIISTVRTYLKAVAPVPPTTDEVIYSTGFAVLRPRSIEPQFLSWLLQSDEFTARIEASSVGVSYPAINASDIMSMSVALPNGSEQIKIADYLDRETAQIDALIAKQEQLIATLRERRSATITQMVLIGIDPAAPTTQIPFLGEVRASWATARFGREIEIARGLVDPRDERWLESVLIAPNHIESGTGRIIARETAGEQGADSGKYVVRAGQILYSKIRPALNKVAIAHEDGLCSADMYALSSSARFDHDYLLYYLLSKPFVAFTTMTSMRVKMPKINREELTEAVLPVPPLADQKEIARAIRAATTKIDALIAKAEQFIALSKERRAALITAAVTGQLEIPA